MMDFSTFEKKIGASFQSKDLLAEALTHRSYINEHREYKLPHNERLEFLGDAVLELVITDYLFHTYPDRAEGELTAFRAALVNTTTLSSAADGLGVNDFLLLSKGEAKDTGRARQYILANAFEAIIGALYLDRGYEAARDFIEQHLFHLADDIVEKRLWQDAKSRFQEIAQEKTSVTPSYNTIEEAGPDHDKFFTIGVYLNDKLIAKGTGKSKQEAEQEAARAALEKGI